MLIAFMLALHNNTLSGPNPISKPAPAMKTSVTAESAIAKREKLLKLYRVKNEYRQFVAHRQADTPYQKHRGQTQRNNYGKKVLSMEDKHHEVH